MSNQPATSGPIAHFQQALEELFEEEKSIARQHLSDPHYADAIFGGRNVGEDELDAVSYARRLNLEPSSDESGNLELFGTRILADLDSLKVEFRTSETDEWGYGIGTLHSVEAKIRSLLEHLGIKIPDDL